MFWMASSWALCCRGQFDRVLVRWGRVANTMLWLLGKNIDGMKMELDIVFRCIQMNQKIYCIYMSRFVAQLYVHSEDVRIWGCSDTFKAAMLPGTQRSTGCLTRFGFGASIDLIHISSFKHPHTISTSQIQTQFSVSETIATARSTKSACHRLSRSISYDFHAELHCVRAGACWVLQGHLVQIPYRVRSPPSTSTPRWPTQKSSFEWQTLQSFHFPCLSLSKDEVRVQGRRRIRGRWSFCSTIVLLWESSFPYVKELMSQVSWTCVLACSSSHLYAQKFEKTLVNAAWCTCQNMMWRLWDSGLLGAKDPKINRNLQCLGPNKNTKS